jgi:starch phosphorylase
MILVASIEGPLLEQSWKGGLGRLIEDLFQEARKEGIEAIFFSINYPKIKKQRYEDGRIEETLQDSSNENLRLIDNFKIYTNWYACEAKIFEHELSTQKTKAYFVSLENDESWLKNLCVYGEGNRGEELYVRYAYSKAVNEWLKKNRLNPKVYHLNESDTALLALPFVDGYSKKDATIIFHSHTPEPWGHKKYPEELVRSLMLEEEYKKLLRWKVRNEIDFGKFLADVADRIICVSQKHCNITKEKIYPEFRDKIVYVTNGIAIDWINEELRDFYDQRIAGWESNIELLKEVKNIENEKIIEVKEKQRKKFNRNAKNLIESGKMIGNFDEKRLSLVYARRLTQYKRPESVLSLLDLDVNLIVAGMPIDKHGEKFLQDVFKRIREGYLISYALNYNPTLAKILFNAYAWLNTPYSEREASGTSFMKALANGMVLITTPAGSVPEFVEDEYNGFLVKEDLSDLREKTKEAIELYNDEEKYAEFVKNTLSTHNIFLPRMLKQIESYWKPAEKILIPQFV